MIRNRGAGHSAAIHADDPAMILRFAAEMDVMRVVINVGCSTGAAGFDTFLGPTMTVGTGFHGRSSIGENIGPQHLVQWTRIAYNSADDIPFGDFTGLALPQPATRPRLPEGRIDYSFDWVGGRPSRPGNAPAADAFAPADADALKAEIRQLILEELRAMQHERQ